MASATKLISEFPSEYNLVAIEDQQKLLEISPAIIVSTIPATAATEMILPEQIFQNQASGVVVEMAYRPKETVLTVLTLKQQGWGVVYGVDVLLDRVIDSLNFGREGEHLEELSLKP